MNSSYGFTLIELLAVLAIVGILIGLTVPVVNSAFQRAQPAETSSNLRQIGIALLSYAADNNNLLPLAGAYIPYGSIDSETELPGWQEQLDSYVDESRKLFLFPEQPREGSTVRNNAGYFLGSRGAYVSAGNQFTRLHMLKIQNPSAYILGGECVENMFAPDDADRDNYTQDAAFGTTGTAPRKMMLLFADGRVEGHDRFDIDRITTRYDGPGLEF